MNCPLCNHEKSVLFHKDAHREYKECAQCALVFVPKEQRLTPEKEKAVYDLHQNNPHDLGYRKFLSRLFDPIAQRVQPGAKGLDFGSGPGPTLSIMFEESGYDMENYDVFYAATPSVLQKKYDFISCSEVIEHLFQPGDVIKHLVSMLVPGGVLGIMTKLVIDQNAFAGWHYITDPTHVCFFSKKTFHWLADHNGCAHEFFGKDVVILQKS